jgi:hypothetical protein
MAKNNRKLEVEKLNAEIERLKNELENTHYSQIAVIFNS